MNFKSKVSIELKKFTKPKFIPQNTVNITYKNFDSSKIEYSFNTDKIKILDMQKLSCTWKEVYKVNFSKSKKYIPGDSIGLIAPNNKKLVDEFLEFCNFENKNIVISKNRRFTFQGYLFDFFCNYFDFYTLPKKAFFHFLDLGNEKLQYLASKEGESEYLNLFLKGNNILEILQYFNVKPNLELLLEYCELIKPRYYSLINEQDQKLEIICGILPNGHFSNFIKQLEFGIEIPYLIKENKIFRMSHTNPILCIATGTGITPFISFGNINNNIILFYGCRNKEDDLSYFVNSKQKFLAFSSQKNSIVKLLKQHKEIVREYLNNYEIYICGSINVRRCITEFFEIEFKDSFSKKNIFFDDWR